MDRKGKILVVEDETVVRESIRDWLLEDGFVVDCAASGEQALEKTGRQDYSVIVLDLRLPGIDGLEVFERVKASAPGTRGIIITAFPSRESQEKARRLGLSDYLPKPFKVQELEKLIVRAMSEPAESRITAKPGRAGAVSFRLCTLDYDCAACEFAQAIQDSSAALPTIGDHEIEALRRAPGNQRPCRYASAR